ncbi:phosphoglycolate phosphatase [Aliikangiella maris]|uniref:Phosphoglycolate phosphatase n=2 Tax=Aliikangiella maris TaxID=3162458 RepID=A0ABV2BYV0_9GAMM
MFNSFIKSHFISSPKWIGFDLDGTLVNSLPDIANALNKTLTQLKQPPKDMEIVKNWIGNGVPMLIKRALSNQINPIESCYQGLFDEALHIFNQAYQDSLCQDSYLYPNVKEVLNKLYEHHVSLALITNKPIEFTLPLLKNLEIEKYFKLVIGGDSLAEKKPSPLPLQYTAEQLSVEVSDGFMVGDSSSDIISARNAGCKVIAVSYGYNHGRPVEELSPDLIIDDLSELLEAVE